MISVWVVMVSISDRFSGGSRVVGSESFAAGWSAHTSTKWHQTTAERELSLDRNDSTRLTKSGKHIKLKIESDRRIKFQTVNLALTLYSLSLGRTYNP